MQTYLIYTKDTAGQRQMEEFGRRLEDIKLSYELLDADAPRGIELMNYYDILARPAILVARTDDGSLIQSWTEPESFPEPSEISYFAHL
jgi:hypothetical protein